MAYINKVQKGAIEYDIQDTRIPTPVANKILGTDNNGGVQWQDAPQSGVTSIGGATGAITLGSGLSMTGTELSATDGSGGVQLYKHSIPLSNSNGGSLMLVLQIISANGTAYDGFSDEAGTTNTIQNDSSKISTFVQGTGNDNSGIHVTMDIGSYNGASIGLAQGTGEAITMYAPNGGFVDTVTTL